MVWTVPGHIRLGYTHARDEYAMHEKIWSEHLKKRDHLRENNVDGNIIL
jgi:hypothetical protein